MCVCVCVTGDHVCIEWNKLQSLSVARQQELENALLRLGQFREAFLELIGWIRECSQKLSQRKEPGVDVEDLEQQLQDLKVRKRTVRNQVVCVCMTKAHLLIIMR